MNKIKLTESQLHRVIKESVKKILKEDNWADGTSQQKAYFIASLENTEEDGEAYHLYDSITHNEISIDDAIQEICGGNPSYIGEGELETVPRDMYIMGYSRDGRYFITYDEYSGDLDVYEKDLNEF